MSETVVYATSGDDMIINRLMRNKRTGNFWIEHVRNVEGSQPIRLAVYDNTVKKIIEAEGDGFKAFTIMEQEVAHFMGGKYDPS